MAESIEKEKDPPSKIPRYSKSKIPILSTEYKNTLRNVSNKKSKVEEYQNKIALMKHGMHECRRKIFLDSEQMPPSSKIISGASTTSRNVVHTPGGTKGPFIIYTSGGHRREIKKSIYKKITQPLWVFKIFLPNL